MRIFLHTVFGLIAASAFVLMFWPAMLEGLIPGFRVEQLGGNGSMRFALFFTFLAALAIRIRVSPGKQATRAEKAWGEFATSVGGTLLLKKMKPTMQGWEGGPTVRWETHGIAIELSGTKDSSGHRHTRLESRVRLSRPFRFYALPRNLLTQALASTQVWNMILEGQKNVDRERQAAGAQTSLAKEMAFMVEKEVTTGDALVDAAVLIKSDDPSAARELFTDSGVSHWLRDLASRSKGWQMNLIVEGSPDQYELSLDVTGLLVEPEDLSAARQLVESAVGRLADRGMIAGDRKVAGLGRS